MGFSFSILSFKEGETKLIILFIPIWLFCVLAESHRAPFDFRERERELVSGYNTEFSGKNFAFIFLSEYAILLLSCLIIRYLFLINYLPIFVFLVIRALMLAFVIT
jgi:NADH:ubiquinone oxidoreductase subunit H